MKEKERTLSRAGLKTTSALFCSRATEALRTPSTAFRADSMEFEQALHVMPEILTWILLLSSSIPSWESRSRAFSKSSESSVAEIFRPAGRKVSCKSLTSPDAIGLVRECRQERIWEFGVKNDGRKIKLSGENWNRFKGRWKNSPLLLTLLFVLISTFFVFSY